MRPASGACQTCKFRRVKCDETKPTCERCRKAKLACIDQSTARQLAMTFHDENIYASGQAKRPRGPRSSLTMRRPQIDLRTRAVSYYVHDHLYVQKHGPSISDGLAETFSAWQTSGSTNPLVDLALSSMALAVFAKAQNHPPAAREASSSYTRLLRLAREQVAQLDGPTLDAQNLDACLLAINFMCRYEGARFHIEESSRCSLVRSALVWSHHDGVVAILKVWYDSPSRCPPTSIIKQTRRGIIRTCLLRNMPLPVWIIAGEVFGEHGPELEFDRVFVPIVSLYCRIAGMTSLQAEQVETLHNEARQLDRALQKWAAPVPRPCSPKKHTLPGNGPWPRASFYSSAVCTYPELYNAGAWSHYYAVGMLINSFRLKVLDLAPRSPTTAFANEMRRLECMTFLDAMADMLASTVPFCLGLITFKRSAVADTSHLAIHEPNDKVRPYLAMALIWPLTIASSICGIDEDRKRWFKAELAKLGRLTGDGIVESAESEDWVAL